MLPSVMNQIAPPSLKLMLNTSESDDIPPMPEGTLPYRAVRTAWLSVAGVSVVVGGGCPNLRIVGIALAVPQSELDTHV